MARTSYTVAEILAQLDAAAEGFDFPDFNNGSAVPLTARLHAFRDDTRWAIVVELAEFNYRAASVMDVVHFFGNCIEGEPGLTEEDFLHRVANAKELRDAADDGGVHDPVVSIRGRDITVPGSFSSPEVLFQAFADVAGGLLLADEAEVRRRIPADLPLLFTLDEWRHPELIDDLPSDSPTFQMVAEALVTGDPGRYAPTEPPNTHWENWPEAGSM